VALLILGAPHPSAARQLIDYLLSRETEQKLAFADCAQIPLHSGVQIPSELKPMEEMKAMPVNYAEVARKMVEIQPLIKTWLEK
jgi:iron(III) transport system substrate-binding protein